MSEGTVTETIPEAMCILSRYSHCPYLLSFPLAWLDLTLFFFHLWFLRVKEKMKLWSNVLLFCMFNWFKLDLVYYFLIKEKWKLLYNALRQELQTFSIRNKKDAFAGHPVSVANTQLCHWSTKATIDTVCMNRQYFVLI